MQRMRKFVNVTVVASSSVALLLREGPQSVADDSVRGHGTSSGSKAGAKKFGQTIYSRVQFDGATSGSRKNGGGGHGMTPRSQGWSPPACWYEPVASPKEFKKFLKEYWKHTGLSSKPFSGGKGMRNPITVHMNDKMRKRYKEGNPYKNFNMKKQGKGKWWFGVVNPNRAEEPGAHACDRKPFWVAKGGSPKQQGAVDAQMLAEAAYGRIRVPGTKVSLNPSGRQTVNLATWAWLDKARFHPVSVRASLSSLGVWAETTARPVGLRLEPGTSDARVFPSSGVCPIRNGRIGQPRRAGVKGKPPCGVEYHHASNGGPFTLRATLRWKVSWHGSGGTGGSLPDGTYGTSRSVTVQEIQSTVTDTR